MRRLRLLGTEWYLSAALNEAGSLTLRLSDGQDSFTATLTQDKLNIRRSNDPAEFAKRLLKGLTQPDDTDKLVLETEPPILKWQASIPTAIPGMSQNMTQDVPLERDPRGEVLRGMLAESADAIACAERDAFAEERRGARLRAELCAIDKIKCELDEGFAESGLKETMKSGLSALNTIKRQIAACYGDDTDDEEASSGDEVQSKADSEATLIDDREPVGDVTDTTTQRPPEASAHVGVIGSAGKAPSASVPAATVSQPPQDVMDLF